MQREWFGFGFLLALGLVASPVLAEEKDDDEKIDLAKVPPAVKKAAEHAVPHVHWTHASKETEKGKTLYELTGKNADKREVEVEVTPEGEVVEIEIQIPLSEVPKVVHDAFKAKYPKLKAEGAESVAKEHGKIIAYDILVKEGKEDEEYRVSADGKTITEEEEEEHEEK